MDDGQQFWVYGFGFGYIVACPFPVGFIQQIGGERGTIESVCGRGSIDIAIGDIAIIGSESQ